MNYRLMSLAERIHFGAFELQWDRLFSCSGGTNGSPSFLAAWLLMLKHMDAFSDEELALDMQSSLSAFLRRNVFST